MPDRRLHPGCIGAAAEARKHLIDDKRKVVPLAKCGDPLQLAALQERAGGVVRAHHGDGPGAGADAVAHPLQVDFPAAAFGILQRVVDQTHTVQPCEHFQQRIAGDGHKDLIARIGKELEKVRVGLARAGRQEQRLCIRLRTALAVGVDDRVPRCPQSLGMRLIAHARRACHRLQDGRRVVHETAAGGVGLREIDDRPAAFPSLLDAPREEVHGIRPGNSLREHRRSRQAQPATEGGFIAPPQEDSLRLGCGLHRASKGGFGASKGGFIASPCRSA